MSLDVSLQICSEVYSHNITHNLGKMAQEVVACEETGKTLYQALWRPDEIGVESGEDLVPLLQHSLQTLMMEGDRLREFNPENGWGNYEQLVTFVQSYLKACILFPDAQVKAWR